MDNTTFQCVIYNQALVLVLLVTFPPSKSTLKAPHRDMKCCGQFSGASWLSCGTVTSQVLLYGFKKEIFFSPTIVNGDLMVLCVFPCWFLSILNDMKK